MVQYYIPKIKKICSKCGNEFEGNKKRGVCDKCRVSSNKSRPGTHISYKTYNDYVKERELNPIRKKDYETRKRLNDNFI